MPKNSAGMLLYRLVQDSIEVLLVHPGGPFWTKRDAGAWSIPKGEFSGEEEPLAAAKREFLEEIGMELAGELIELTPVKQKGGKTVYAWALRGDIDPATIRSNTFEIEWPPGSGRKQQFPEIDRGQWFGIEAARRKINPAQIALIDELLRKLAAQET